MEEIELNVTSSSSRIHFTWGTGNELHLVESNALSPAAPSAPVYSNIRWGHPSSSERKTVHDILPVYQDFQRLRLSPGLSEAAGTSNLLSYAQKVSAALASTLNATGAAPGELGVGRAVWELLTLFYARGARGEAATISDGFSEFVRRNLRSLPGAEGSQFFQYASVRSLESRHVTKPTPFSTL